MIADNRHYEKVGSEIKDITDDLPFEIPDSWVWTRLEKAVIINPRNNLSDDIEVSFVEMKAILDGYTNQFIATNRLWKEVKRGFTHFQESDVGFAKITPCFQNRKSVVFTNLRNGYGAGTTELHVLRPIQRTIVPNYLLYFVKSSYFIEHGKQRFSGTAGQQRFGTDEVKKTLFPLPPLAEQARIVAEIEKFEPLIAEYDKLEQQATKLDDEIYDKLKKSILQYAIQGKLVPQDPNDEPASVLLERIRAEKKAKLGKKYVDSCIYKGDDNCYYEKVGASNPVCLDNLPFDIPDSWCWAKLKDITYNHGQKIPNAEFSYIDIGSIDNVKQKLSAKENIIEPEKAPSRARKIVERGDVLYATVRPYLHNMCIVDKDFSHEPIASTGFAVLAVKKGIKNTFLFYYMLSPIFDQYANNSENSKGVAYPAINDEKLYKALIPIPPQNEQQNICKLIDKCFNVLMLKDEG